MTHTNEYLVYEQTSEAKTLADIFRDIGRARTFILGGLVSGVICAVAFLYVTIPQQKAMMIIAPTSPMNGAQVSSMVNDQNLFALQYVMQRVGVGASSNFTRFENIYNGASVARRLLDDPKIKTGLTIDNSFRFLSPKQEYSAESLSAYIKKRVHLDPVGASSLRQLSYMHSNGAFAKYFLYALHNEADNIIRTRLQAETSERISYLQDNIAATNNPEHRRALASLLMEQERLRMLASIETSYAASVVEPPSTLPKPAWPSKSLIILSFLTAGFILALMGYHVKEAFYLATQTTPDLARAHEGGSKKRWFKTNSRNNNEKPLTGQAEEPPLNKRA